MRPEISGKFEARDTSHGEHGRGSGVTRKISMGICSLSTIRQQLPQQRVIALCGLCAETAIPEPHEQFLLTHASFKRAPVEFTRQPSPIVFGEDTF
jgi:hypothetical protein